MPAFLNAETPSRQGAKTEQPLLRRASQTVALLSWAKGAESGNYEPMCGRYSLSQEDSRFRQRLRYPEQLALTPRYNIAPTQQAAVIVADEGGVHLRLLRWGLIPFWAKDETIGNTLINARSETVASKPAFRHSLKRRRCLVLADGFYEWAKQSSGPKQPYRITLANDQPFTFAGLWDRWRTPTGEELETFTILTTEANSLLASMHHRMPVILAEDQYEGWLNGDATVEQVQGLLRPFDPEQMRAFAVSRAVNNVKNDTPSCMQPLESLAGMAPSTDVAENVVRKKASTLAPPAQGQLPFDVPQ